MWWKPLTLKWKFLAVTLVHFKAQEESKSLSWKSVRNEALNGGEEFCFPDVWTQLLLVIQVVF